VSVVRDVECVGRLWVIVFYVAYMFSLTNIFLIASKAGTRIDAVPDIGCGGGCSAGGF